MIDAHRRHRVAARRSVDREQSLVAPAALDHSTMDLAAQLWDRELTPAAAATQHELARRFQDAIELLEETDREVILLRHFEQLSNQETAQVLGLSEPAAGMRYLRDLPAARDAGRRRKSRVARRAGGVSLPVGWWLVVGGWGLVVGGWGLVVGGWWLESA